MTKKSPQKSERIEGDFFKFLRILSENICSQKFCPNICDPNFCHPQYLWQVYAGARHHTSYMLKWIWAFYVGNGNGPPLPGCVYEHTMLFCRRIIRAKLFGWNICSRCCSAEIYTCDAVLLEYIIICDAALLEYIRAMLGVATPGSGDPKPLRRLLQACIGSNVCIYWPLLFRAEVGRFIDYTEELKTNGTDIQSKLHNMPVEYSRQFRKLLDVVGRIGDYLKSQ